MRNMVTASRTARPTRSYAVEDLVTGMYGPYLTKYEPRKAKQKRKTGKNNLIGPFYTIQPYTITLMGYLNGQVDIYKLYDALARLVRNMEVSDEEDGGFVPSEGSINPVVSPDGRAQFVGKDEERTSSFLPNHTSIKMWLSKDQCVQIRMSKAKIEVIGCKRDEDIVDAWAYMCDYINSLEEEVRIDPSIQLELIMSYGAMRNYAFTLGFSLDVTALCAAITALNGDFTAGRNPSLQMNLRVSHPSSGNTPPTSVTRSSDKKGSARSKELAATESKPHVISVFHTGRCLYSGKGPLKECEMVFERFRTLISGLRESVEITTDGLSTHGHLAMQCLEAKANLDCLKASQSLIRPSVAIAQ